MKDQVLDISTAIETITPAMAEKWLEHNYAHNRSLRFDWIKQLAGRMAAGNWKVTHQGIAFSESGELVDGQHRLWAIMESGCTVRMMVTRGVPDESFGVLDQGKGRSVADLAGEKWVTPFIVSFCRAMVRGPVQGTIGAFDDRDPSLLLEFIKTRRDHVEKVMALFPVNKTARGRANLTAIITGAIARAAYHVPHPVLARFIEVMVTGESAGVNERGAILLRDWVHQGKRRDRSAEYQKAQRAIRAFVEGDPLTVLYAQADDLFQLPGLASKRPVRADAAQKRARVTEKRKVEVPKRRAAAKG